MFHVDISLLHEVVKELAIVTVQLLGCYCYLTHNAQYQCLCSSLQSKNRTQLEDNTYYAVSRHADRAG